MPEIERKFRVHDVPHPLGDGTRLRQAYLAVDGDIEVRVRDRGGTLVLGVKGGRGLERSEVEVEIDGATFDELWSLATRRLAGPTQWQRLRVRSWRHAGCGPASASAGATGSTGGGVRVRSSSASATAASVSATARARAGR